MKDDTSFAGYDSTLLTNSNQFTVAANGGAAKTVTLDGTFAATKVGADSFLGALNTALGAASTGVTASWDATSGGLALTSTTPGALSSVVLGSATYVTAAVQQSTTVTNPGADTLNADVTTSATHNSFNIALDGGPTYTVAVADATYSTASGLVAAINAAINLAGTGELSGKVTASFNAANQLVLTDTSATTGLSSSLNLSATAGNDGLTAIFGFTASTTRGDPAAVNTGLTTIHLNASTTSAAGNAAAVNGGLATFGLAGGTVTANGNSTHSNAGLATMGLTAGLHVGAADGARTAASIAADIQTAFGGTALVTVSNDYKISIASTTKGANSTVVVNTPVTNSANATLHLVAGTTLGVNSSIGDIVDNINAQFAANSTYQAAGLTAAATLANGTSTGNFITIQSNNATQFRLNSVGAAAVATAGAVASTVTSANIATGPITVLDTGANHQFNIAVDGGSAVAVTVANGTYNTATTFLNAVNAGINGSALSGLVTAGWDATTNKLTLTSATTGAASSVALTAVGGNTGLGHLGFAASTNSGQTAQVTENTGFGVAGTTFASGVAPSSTGTAMSAVDAFGISNSTAFTFSAMQYGNDKQALTFSATDANGVLETKTITLQNDKSTNRAGVSIDDAVAYINTQLQQSTSQPALQQIVAVKENVGAQEKINFVSSLSVFTVGVAATANGDGLNGGAAIYRTSASNGDGANMQVDSKEAAKAAVTAIATAIGKLGSAQAAVGKGQNQLYYAVNLAQSQITNFSAAESYIRDANVAQQAANLTKAQVLSQASIAAMAQANSAPQAILALLRG
jgi:flagellin